jgi:hypothetical protein
VPFGEAKVVAVRGQDAEVADAPGAANDSGRNGETFFPELESGGISFVEVGHDDADFNAQALSTAGEFSAKWVAAEPELGIDKGQLGQIRLRHDISPAFARKGCSPPALRGRIWFPVQVSRDPPRGFEAMSARAEP